MDASKKRRSNPLKIIFWASDKPREHMLAKALEIGAINHGDTLEIRRTSDYGEDPNGDDRRYAGPSPDTEVACCFGVKGASKQILGDHAMAGIPTLYFDKGFTRAGGEGGHTLYSRICINATHPLAYMMLSAKPDDRWRQLKLKLGKRGRAQAGHVLYCGSSQKYHEFHGIGEATDFAYKVFRRLRKQTERHLVYRPKPSWHDAVPIAGVSMSYGGTSLEDALRGCHCLVTHGSSAAMEAIIAGVPAIVLGPSIARPVAEVAIDQVENPKWADDAARLAWASNMAYCQWTADELRSGEAWAHLRAEIVRQKLSPPPPYALPVVLP